MAMYTSARGLIRALSEISTVRIFDDRVDAGRELAKLLEQYRGHDVVVYGLPRGGVVVAKTVAERLGAPLDIVVARKLGHPDNPEYAMGAVTDDGSVVLDPITGSHLSQDWIEAERDRQSREARRRVQMYLGSRIPIPAKDKTAILVDDGIATGYTMEAAILSVRKREPESVVVASPVAATFVADRLAKLADDMVVAQTLDDLFAVSQVYLNFAQVTDDDVVELLS